MTPFFFVFMNLFVHISVSDTRLWTPLDHHAFRLSIFSVWSQTKAVMKEPHNGWHHGWIQIVTLIFKTKSEHFFFFFLICSVSSLEENKYTNLGAIRWYTHLHGSLESLITHPCRHMTIMDITHPLVFLAVSFCFHCCHFFFF